MASSEPRQIDWSSARIEDGTLTVQLNGSASKAWKSRFENVRALLDTTHSSWGEVKLTKNAIKVADLKQGSESELRHLLESILLQANSDTTPDAPATTRRKVEAEDSEPGPEEQMTQTFRGFAAERQRQ